MEHTVDAPAVQRRKRKVARQLRDKTPEPRSTSAVRKYSDDESSSTAADQLMNTRTKFNTAANISNQNQHDTNSSAAADTVQTVRMQIRPPGTMSAHESKILRRRNHGFSGAAARSQSQPRPADADDIQFTASQHNQNNLRPSLRRSLSSTRHQDQDEINDLDESRSSENTAENFATKIIAQYSPLPELHRKLASGNAHNVDEEKIFKLERNLRRFDTERQKFEMEKKKFDREKRELHKIRYRQMLENEERKRMLLNYRKLSGERSMPSDSDDYRHKQLQQQRVTQSFREPRRSNTGHQDVKKQELIKPKKYREYESSTVSESDSDVVTHRRSQSRPGVEVVDSIVRHRSTSRRDEPQPMYDDTTIIGPTKITYQDSANQQIKTPSPSRQIQQQQQHPIAPERKFLSRKSSLSPMRERKKSQTPETVVAANPLPPNLEPTKLEKLQVADVPVKPTLFSRIFLVFKRKQQEELCDQTIENVNFKAYFSWTFIRLLVIELRKEWAKLKSDYPEAIKQIQYQRNKCFSHFIILALYVGFGGLVFRFTEGTFENIFKCEVRKVKRDFIDQLWTTSHNLREDDWKSSARTKLRKFEEELHVVHESGFRYAGMKSWNFLNSVIFCFTVVTRIGYGHIAPQTTLGRSITIVYAIIGIPIFLILLADFGKLFTRCMKFLWAYIRRLYYTGTCRKVRKNQQMLDMMKGINTVYDVAIRRPSQFIRDIDVENVGKTKSEEPETPASIATVPISQAGTCPDTPNSPYPETFEVDDEFNLPVSVASTILILYIITGAMIYASWEQWTYFESFYFVFISMSTIGFGDFVPNHPIFMMCSIVYLVFGLALTSMFINVVQIKLSDSFNQASAKISATIGLTLAEEELSRNSQLATPTPEVPAFAVHAPDTPNSGEYEGVNAAIPKKTEQPPNGNNIINADHISTYSPPPPPILPRTSASAAAVQHLLEEENAKKNKKKFYFK